MQVFHSDARCQIRGIWIKDTGTFCILWNSSVNLQLFQSKKFFKKVLLWRMEQWEGAT
jgi:hypothetical protein